MTVPPRNPRLATVAEIADRMRFARPDAPLLGHTIFLIGAGCSVSAGVPGATSVAQLMVREVARRMNTCAHDVDDEGCYLSLVAAGKLGALVDPIIEGKISLPWHFGGQADFFLLFVFLNFLYDRSKSKYLL